MAYKMPLSGGIHRISSVLPKTGGLDVNYVHRYLLAIQPFIFKELARGAAQPHVYPRDLAGLPIPLPPLEEQQRIVAVLDEAFEGLTRARARAITFQLAEVAVTGPMVRAIFATIRRLRAPPSCA
jgi:restriction endonuclease S subunit